MIQIVGPQLRQWDVGRSVGVSDSKATHVHFANQGDSKAVIIEITNGTAKIPDYLLQTGKALNAYAVLDGVTLESRSFAVCKRERPENYVYEDDRRNYIYDLITSAEAAVENANQAAQNANEAVENANQAAQNANEAAEKLGSIVIPTKVSQLQNDSGFLTEAPVTSVNGQTGDVILSQPVLVTVSKREDGTYEADRTYSELKAAREAGSTLLCRYYDEDVYLPFASWHGVFTFCAVVDNVSYQINISTREQVFFQRTELVTDLTGYATQGYVDEAIEGIPEAITPPDTAAVGQTIVVKEVDENGKPVLWEAADFPSGGSNSFRTLITVEEDTAGLVVSVPVSWENILQYNIHFVFPEPIAVTEASKFNVKVFDRHWSGNINKTTQVNLYGVRYGYNGNFGVVSVTMTTSPDWFGTAMPDMVNGTQNYYYVGGENYANGENKCFRAWITNGLPIPAGTLIEVWGVYVS